MHHSHTGFTMSERSHTFTKPPLTSQRKEPILLLSEHKVNNRTFQIFNCVTFVYVPWLCVSLPILKKSPGGPWQIFHQKTLHFFFLIRAPGIFLLFFDQFCVRNSDWLGSPCMCLTLNECIQNLHWCVDDQLRIRNLEVKSDKCSLSSAIGIYLPLPMHSTASSVCWVIGWRWWLQLLGSQFVWVHFFPLHGKWLWGPEGTDISGAWPSSSCFYLTLYCDDPVMRTGIGPHRSLVGNFHSRLALQYVLSDGCRQSEPEDHSEYC